MTRNLGNFTLNISIFLFQVSRIPAIFPYGILYPITFSSTIPYLHNPSWGLKLSQRRIELSGFRVSEGKIIKKMTWREVPFTSS